jgi:hypothetical protein
MIMSFSATDAAFEGFRVVRRAPLSLLAWVLVYLVFGMGMFAAGAPALTRMMAMMEALEGETNASFAELSELGRVMGGLGLTVLPLALAMGAVLSAAVCRAVLSPEAKAWGYVRVGMDEIRVLATQIIVSLVIFAITMIIYMALVALGLAAHMMNQPWLWLLVVLGAFAGIGLVIWLSVRWSLATPIALAEKRIAPFASFALTRGRFWPLLGMAILAGVMAVVVSVLFSIVSFPLEAIFGGTQRLAAYDGQDFVAIITQAWPIVLVWVLVNAVSSALQLAVMYAPFTAAYLILKSEKSA